MATAAEMEHILSQKLVKKYGAAVGITQAQLDDLASGTLSAVDAARVTDRYDELLSAFKRDLVHNDFVSPAAGGGVLDDALVDILMCAMDANYRYADREVDATGSEKPRFLRKIYPDVSRINGVAPGGYPGPPVLTGCLGVEGLTENLSPQQAHDQCGLDYDASEFNRTQADGTLVKRPTVIEVNVPVTPEIDSLCRIPLDPRIIARMLQLSTRSPPDELSRRAQDMLARYGKKLCPVLCTESNAGSSDPTERARGLAEIRAILSDSAVRDAYNSLQALQGRPRIDFSDPAAFESMKKPYSGTGIPLHGAGLFAQGGHADIRQELRVVKDANGKWPQLPVGSTISIKLPKDGISRARAEDPKLPAGADTVVLAVWGGRSWQRIVDDHDMAALNARLDAVYSSPDYQVDVEDPTTHLPVKTSPWLDDAKAQVKHVSAMPLVAPPAALKQQIRKQQRILREKIPQTATTAARSVPTRPRADKKKRPARQPAALR